MGTKNQGEVAQAAFQQRPAEASAAASAGAGVGPEQGGLRVRAQRAQYPLIKEYTLNYRGLNLMI